MDNKTCEYCKYWIVGPWTHNHYLRYCQNKMVKRLIRGFGGGRGNALLCAGFGCKFWEQKETE